MYKGENKMNTNGNFVICPICNKQFKQINTAHLRERHGISLQEFKSLYPDCKTLSDNQRRKKATLLNLTQQQSKNLKFGHTLQGFIKRYGETEGKRRYQESKIKKSKSHSLQWFVQKYGVNAEQMWINYKKNKGLTLEKYVKKYGKLQGVQKYQDFKAKRKYQRSVHYYMDKYGQQLGLEKWVNKNQKNSESSRKINIQDIEAYKLYSTQVDKETNLSISLYGLPGLELRSRQNGCSLDHKISKCFGFNNNIEPNIIGNIHNLQIIPIKDNCSKGANCSIQLNQLLNKMKKEK